MLLECSAFFIEQLQQATVVVFDLCVSEATIKKQIITLNPFDQDKVLYNIYQYLPAILRRPSRTDKCCSLSIYTVL